MTRAGGWPDSAGEAFDGGLRIAVEGPARGLAPAGPGHGPPLTGRGRALRALALLAVDPALGGAVLVGPPGCGKGTLARAFPSLAGMEGPLIEASAGDADWDRWQGGLDWEATLRAGRPVTRPGLWEQARGGALLLTRGESMGRPLAAWLARALERPGAPVVLVSVTLHPDDGGAPHLEPLALRLAFWLPFDGPAGVEEREGVLRAALGRGSPPGLPLPEQVTAARERLPYVRDDESLLRDLLAASSRLGWANPVLDRLLWRAARAHAALEGRDRVDLEDAEAALHLVVVPRAAGGGAEHRAGAQPEPHGRTAAPRAVRQPEASPSRLASGSADAPASRASAPSPGGEPIAEHPGDAASAPSLPQKAQTVGLQANPEAGVLHVYEAALQWRHHRLASRLSRPPEGADPAGAPRRGPGLSASRRPGRPPRRALPAKAGSAPGQPTAGPQPPGGTLALAATLLAALPHQPFRRPRPGLALALAPEDLRWRRPARTGGCLFILAVDGSGSMGAARTRAAKGLALALLKRAYVQRAHVALLRVAGKEARIVLPPSRSGPRAERALAGIATGGGTPLAAALVAMEAMAARYRRRFPEAEVVGLLLTDGRANVPWGAGRGSDLPDKAWGSSRQRGNGPWSGAHLDPGREEVLLPSAAVQEELVALASRLRRQGVALVVLDREGPGSPSADARALAERLQCPFIPL